MRQGALQYWRGTFTAPSYSAVASPRPQSRLRRLVDQVMDQSRIVQRVAFWIVDNGSSHRGERAAGELRERHPRIVVVHTPVHASWLNQIEQYFSILQRKVLTPNDLTSLKQLEARIIAFGARYSALRKPFAWTFTRQELERRLRDPLLDADPVPFPLAA
jgi:transposase